jgi:hypothetical protein
MSMIYYPSCLFTAKYPESSKKIKTTCRSIALRKWPDAVNPVSIISQPQIREDTSPVMQNSRCFYTDNRRWPAALGTLLIRFSPGVLGGIREIFFRNENCRLYCLPLLPPFPNRTSTGARTVRLSSATVQSMAMICTPAARASCKARPNSGWVAQFGSR